MLKLPVFRHEKCPVTEFTDRNNLYITGDFIYPRSVSHPDFFFRQPITPGGQHFRYIEQPLNPKKAELLSTPSFLNNYFNDRGFNISLPTPLINQKGTTLFVCAGVQVLDNIIHQEAPVPLKPLFVAQPVLRTQFIDNICEGTSTSFINVSTCHLNGSQEQHYQYLQTWLDLFVQLGLNKDDFSFKNKPYQQQWGDKIINSQKMFIIYDGLEIGDASYIQDLPQKTRPNLTLSDIGFGLERIKWILQGGSYFDILGDGRVSHEITGDVAACSHTLSLLAGEGLKPSNKEHGYRFRLFSKKLVNNALGEHLISQEQAKKYYNYWEKWTKLVSPLNQSIESLAQENTRNFNRLLLDKLSTHCPDVELNINQPTDMLIKQLKGTSVKSDYLTVVLGELKYSHD